MRKPGPRGARGAGCGGGATSGRAAEGEAGASCKTDGGAGSVGREGAPEGGRAPAGLRHSDKQFLEPFSRDVRNRGTILPLNVFGAHSARY